MTARIRKRPSEGRPGSLPCQALACGEPLIGVTTLVCSGHWRALPVRLRQAVASAWRARERAYRVYAASRTKPALAAYARACRTDDRVRRQALAWLQRVTG